MEVKRNHLRNYEHPLTEGLAGFIRFEYSGGVNVSPVRLRVKELRNVRGWSQEELSRRAEVRQATISDLENGKAKSVDLTLLERLATAFEVDAGYLFVTIPKEPKSRRK